MFFRLNYKGDLTRDVIIGQRLGEDVAGRPYKVFDVEYHADTDKTAVHLTY